ncbi:MAG: phosphonoacetaldehyde hydrolase [Spirochaetota bacterium]
MNAIRTIIFDWAGTIIDHGVFAPIEALVQSFAGAGCPVTAGEARGPMGVHKRDHIRMMLENPDVSRRWATASGALPTRDDVDRIYQTMLSVQLEAIRRHSEPIAGLAELLRWLREHGIRTAGTTGYVRSMLDVAEGCLLEYGLKLDFTVAADEVPDGRPAAYGCWKAAAELGTPAAALCVKVGDTVPDIEEGRNAGMWSVGVVETGNLVGLSAEEVRALPGYPEARPLVDARRVLIDAGAHEVIAGIWELPAALERIGQRLDDGQRP